MKATLRGVLLVAGLLAGLMFVSASGRSETTARGRTTVATIGTPGPWFEYKSTPERWDYGVDLLSGSMFFGLVSVVCLWARSRLSQSPRSAAKASDQPQSAAIEAT